MEALGGISLEARVVEWRACGGAGVGGVVEGYCEFH